MHKAVKLFESGNDLFFFGAKTADFSVLD